MFARDRHWVETKASEQPYQPLTALSLPELARAAAEGDGGAPIRGLRHVVWGRPAAHGTRLKTVIDRDELGRLFRIVADGAEWAPCMVGEVADSVPPPPEPIGPPTGDDVTPDFRRFAPDCRMVNAVWRRGDEVWAQGTLATPPTGFDPVLLDLGWRLAAFRLGDPPQHPQAAEAISLYGPLPAQFLIRVWLRPGAAHPSIALLDQQGTTRLCLDGLRTAPDNHLADILLGENTAS